MFSNINNNNQPTSQQSLPIRYKNFDSDNLVNVEFNRIVISPNSDGYLSANILSNIDLSYSNSVFINTNTGSVKSSAIYELIYSACQSGKYKVIVASPRQSLVQKDYQHLTNASGRYSLLKERVINYSDLSKNTPVEELLRLASAPVHVMTVSCLFGNSGDSIIPQAKYKQTYIRAIESTAQLKHQKIIIIIDELHDAIDYIASDKVHWLSHFNSNVHKIIMATATYTESCHPFILEATCLTNNSLKVIEDERFKRRGNQLADLEFYVCRNDAFNSNNIVFN